MVCFWVFDCVVRRYFHCFYNKEKCCCWRKKKKKSWRRYYMALRSLRCSRCYLTALFLCFFVFLILCQSVMSHIMNSVQHQKTNKQHASSLDRIEEEEEEKNKYYCGKKSIRFFCNNHDETKSPVWSCGVVEWSGEKI